PRGGCLVNSVGHTAKLSAPQLVKPSVKSHKNDPGDAEAICEAVTRPTRRLVPIKKVAQLDLQSLHRARGRCGSAPLARAWRPGHASLGQAQGRSMQSVGP